MPLGPFPDFETCVREMEGKVDDPEAYCGALEQDASSMAGMWIVADLAYDSDEDAREAERLAREGKVAGVSIDYALQKSEIEITEVDEDGFPTDWIERGLEAEIIGATQLPMPAFADARIEFTDNGPLVYLAPEGKETSDKRMFPLGAFTWRDPAPFMFIDRNTEGHADAVHVGNLSNFRRVDEQALVAASDPQLAGLMKPKVEDGKIIGHGAGWGTCHTAFQNACVTPPESTYKHVEDGVKIYRHPHGDIHAPLGLSLEDAMKWYDAHCELVGVAGVGEDTHGIWVNGESTLDDGDVFLSGDWRNDSGQLELVSFLVVDNPGFPTAMVASETQQALTAAGIVRQSDALVDRVARLERIVEDYRSEKQSELINRKAAELDFGDEIGILASRLDF